MELRDYARILRAHWIVIVVATLVGAAAAFGWSALQPRVYSADTTGIVTAVGGDGTSGSALVGNQLAQSRVKSYLNLGSWRAVAEHAMEELDIDTSPDVLVNRVTVTNPVDTTALKVTATGPTPESAQALAQAWLDGMAIEIEKLEGGTAEAPAAISHRRRFGPPPQQPVLPEHTSECDHRRPRRPRARTRLRVRAAHGRPSCASSA
ncbi:YveK family protein [Microbacterium sp. Se5.02b]|uniref:YveK family protein n=1 Tax=Microbacterium sp. Se5.02b TaxID=2864103 RepID=UPI001C68B210|nr:hypothetical protein [Microbacterium sp. Se5.02b]QYM65234.1 hypothetical protein K1X59_05370 [Microbacterium sp. Se5.02b]